MVRTSTLVRRWLAAWGRTTPEQRAYGAAWYPTARGMLAVLAAGCGVSFPTATAVVAALSPRTAWGVNVAMATKALRTKGRASCHTKATMRTVRALLRGEDALRGPKVRAFAAALVGDDNAAVLDRHMLRIAGVGHPGNEGSRTCTTAEYRRAADALRVAARMVGVTPAAFQATLWVAERARAARKGRQMRVLNIIPAYGRSYKSLAAVRADWVAGKDFADPDDGRYVNVLDVSGERGRRADGSPRYTHVKARYGKGLAKVGVFALDPNGPAETGL